MNDKTKENDKTKDDDALLGGGIPIPSPLHPSNLRQMTVDEIIASRDEMDTGIVLCYIVTRRGEWVRQFACEISHDITKTDLREVIHNIADDGLAFFDESLNKRE